MKFFALDVETANPDMASICQIGIVQFENGVAVDSWSTLVDPNDYFDCLNVSIHGIDEKAVKGAPDFSQASEELRCLIESQVVATHTAFDRVAISQAGAKHKVTPPDCIWINTASVARRAWPDVSKKGYGLAALAKKLGIAFEHHNAVEDARAAGLIFSQAINDSNLDISGWLDRLKLPINYNPENSSNNVSRDVNPDGPLFGEIVVFTGALSIPRNEAADKAALAGCQVANGVTKRTTLLVVGDQDIRLLNGHLKSNKHRRAEELISTGIPIRILTESDFAAIV